MKYEKAKAITVSFSYHEFMVMSSNAIGGVYCEDFSMLADGHGHCVSVWSYNTTTKTWIKHPSGNWKPGPSWDPDNGEWIFF